MTELVKFTGERLSLFIHYTVKVCRRIVNKCVTTSFEALLLFFAALLDTY